MSDRVLVPLPGIGTLALSREAFADALAAGAAATGAPAPSPAVHSVDSLLDADQAAGQLNVTARWLEDSARAGIVPHYKPGRFIRFRVSEIADHCRVEGAPLPVPTDSQTVGQNSLVPPSRSGGDEHDIRRQSAQRLSDSAMEIT